MSTLKALKINEKDLKTFIRESNAIENEYSKEAYINAVKAWKFLSNFGTLTLSNVLETHRILMIDLEKKIAGKIRTVNVSVGCSINLKHETVEEKLEQLLCWTPKTAEEIKKWHIDFEEIHPFNDGNGRVGRILYNHQRLLNGFSLDIIEEKNKQLYYKWFRK